jgi:gamma-glutamylcyclotransferase (GGCT)/AIG2-like uncharacterized protein YtfP
VHLLFVYGTLKRGFCREVFLAGQRYLGAASTTAEYRLYDLGSFPGMVEAGAGGVAIIGELYEIDDACLRLLDQEEGVDDGLYRRAEVRLLSEQAEHSPTCETARATLNRRLALTYLFNQTVTGFRDVGSTWQRQTPRGPVNVDRS